jgi:hypothetical protein
MRPDTIAESRRSPLSGPGTTVPKDFVPIRMKPYKCPSPTSLVCNLEKSFSDGLLYAVADVSEPVVLVSDLFPAPFTALLRPIRPGCPSLDH